MGRTAFEAFDLKETIMRGTRRPSNGAVATTAPSIPNRGRTNRGSDDAAPRLCPRCHGSFVLTCVRDDRVSVECPLCGRLWAEPPAQTARSPRRAAGARPPATSVLAGAAA